MIVCVLYDNLVVQKTSEVNIRVSIASKFEVGTDPFFHGLKTKNRDPPFYQFV